MILLLILQQIVFPRLVFTFHRCLDKFRLIKTNIRRTGVAIMSIVRKRSCWSNGMPPVESRRPCRRPTVGDALQKQSTFRWPKSFALVNKQIVGVLHFGNFTDNRKRIQDLSTRTQRDNICWEIYGIRVLVTEKLRGGALILRSLKNEMQNILQLL